MNDILVIDDEVSIRNMVWRILQAEGFTVHLAKDGKEALEKLKQENPKMVLLDHLLPDTSGLELLKIIKSYDSNIAVLMMTGYMSEEESNKALAEGAFDFIKKPLDIEYLRRTVKAKMLTLAD